MTRFSAEELPLKGAYLITPFYSADERGGLIKDYSLELLKEFGIDHPLKEVFYTISHKGVIRAIHFQRVKQQPKLVRCVKGHVYDVIVDLRPSSPTYKQWLGFDLTGKSMKELLVPAGFGHGYLVLEESIVSYKCSEKFYAEYDGGIIWNDPDINIKWPLERLGDIEPILSEKDRNLPTLERFVREKTPF